MAVRTGCDIVHIGRLEESAKNGGSQFLERLFSQREIDAAKSVHSLAGLFAAKEAVIKALGLGAGKWRAIEITKDKSGRPRATVNTDEYAAALCDVSISHDGDYAFAVAIFVS